MNKTKEFDIMDKPTVSIPRVMKHKEWCLVCGKEMDIGSPKLSKAGDSVDIHYSCKCGYELTFAYLNGYVEMFKKVMVAIGQENSAAKFAESMAQYMESKEKV